MRILPLAGFALPLISFVLAVTPEAAEPTSPPGPSPADARGIVAVPPQNSAIPPARGGGSSQIAARGAPIVLEVGKGTLIRLGQPAATVFIANPDPADV